VIHEVGGQQAVPLEMETYTILAPAAEDLTDAKLSVPPPVLAKPLSAAAGPRSPTTTASFYFVVASHNSSAKLQRTLEHLLVHVPPSHVVVADNGSRAYAHAC
jgi:hypothetical protein